MVGAFWAYLLIPHKPRKNLRPTRECYLDTLCIFSKIYGNLAFTSAAPRLWNKLPVDTRTYNSCEQVEADRQSSDST